MKPWEKYFFSSKGKESTISVVIGNTSHTRWRSWVNSFISVGSVYISKLFLRFRELRKDYKPNHIQLLVDIEGCGWRILPLINEHPLRFSLINTANLNTWENQKIWMWNLDIVRRRLNIRKYEQCMNFLHQNTEIFYYPGYNFGTGKFFSISSSVILLVNST